MRSALFELPSEVEETALHWRASRLEEHGYPTWDEALSIYGEHVGLAFQIVDDILDVEQTSAQLGKTAGKDAAQGKITFPAVYGLEVSREMADEQLELALSAVEPFGDRAHWLRELAALIVRRTS